MRVVADDDVDRRQVHAWRHVEPSRTNDPKAFLSRASPAGKPVGAGEQPNAKQRWRDTARVRSCESIVRSRLNLAASAPVAAQSVCVRVPVDGFTPSQRH